MRKTEIASRSDFFAMLEATNDQDLVESLDNDLYQWEGAEDCERIEFTTDSLGRLDSESSPRPA